VGYVVAGYIVVAAFLAVFVLLAVGALALQVLGITGRLRRREMQEGVNDDDAKDPGPRLP
jgi:hypothetical protein